MCEAGRTGDMMTHPASPVLPGDRRPVVEISVGSCSTLNTAAVDDEHALHKP